MVPLFVSVSQRPVENGSSFPRLSRVGATCKMEGLTCSLPAKLHNPMLEITRTSQEAGATDEREKKLACGLVPCCGQRCHRHRSLPARIK
jgi:hypothetical protein